MPDVFTVFLNKDDDDDDDDDDDFAPVWGGGGRGRVYLGYFLLGICGWASQNPNSM